MRDADVREVFEVEFDDIVEVHLHPADVSGAIVSLSEPRPPGSWRWGGEDWQARSVPGAVTAITVAVTDPGVTQERWVSLAGGEIPGCTFVAGDGGIVAIELDGRAISF